MKRRAGDGSAATIGEASFGKRGSKERRRGLCWRVEIMKNYQWQGVSSNYSTERVRFFVVVGVIYIQIVVKAMHIRCGLEWRRQSHRSCVIHILYKHADSQNKDGLLLVLQLRPASLMPQEAAASSTKDLIHWATGPPHEVPSFLECTM